MMGRDKRIMEDQHDAMVSNWETVAKGVFGLFLVLGLIASIAVGLYYFDCDGGEDEPYPTINHHTQSNCEDLSDQDKVVFMAFFTFLFMILSSIFGYMSYQAILVRGR